MDASLVSKQHQAEVFQSLYSTYRQNIITVNYNKVSSLLSIGPRGTHFGKLLLVTLLK
jgi:hypothetical protein